MKLLARLSLVAAAWASAAATLSAQCLSSLTYAPKNPIQGQPVTLTSTVALDPYYVPTALPNGPAAGGYLVNVYGSDGQSLLSNAETTLPGTLVTSITPFYGFGTGTYTASFGYQWVYAYGFHGTCGSSSFPALGSSVQFTVSPQTQAGTDANLLNGQYAFLFEGTGQSSSPVANRFASAGSFTADGSGNITAGIEDINSASLREFSVPFTGTYTLNGPRGTLTFQTSLGTEQFDFFLSNTPGSFSYPYGTPASIAQQNGVTHADLIDTSPGILGSGSLLRQTPPAQLAGQYSLKLQAYPPLSSALTLAGDPAFLAGTFTAVGSVLSARLDINSAQTGPLRDIFESGSSEQLSPVTSRFGFSLAPAGQNLRQPIHYLGYVVDPSHIFILSSDPYTDNYLVSGTAVQ